MKLQSDLREFIELLNSHGVEYLVVGGHAVAYHGYPRYTGDIDLWVRPSESNAECLMAALSQFGFGDVGLSKDVFSRPGQVVQLGRPPNRIDLLTQITAVGFAEAWDRSIETKMDDVIVRIIGREDLLQNKRATDRSKDQADVGELEKIGRNES